MLAGEIGFAIALIDFFTREAGGRFTGSGRGVILARVRLREREQGAVDVGGFPLVRDFHPAGVAVDRFALRFADHRDC